MLLVAVAEQTASAAVGAMLVMLQMMLMTGRRTPNFLLLDLRCCP